LKLIIKQVQSTFFMGGYDFTTMQKRSNSPFLISQVLFLFFSLFFVQIFQAQDVFLSQQGHWENEPFGSYEMNSEFIERRSQNEKHFKKIDGSTDMYVSSTPLNYFKDGQWNTIYNTISSNNSNYNTEFKYANLENTFQSFYGENIQQGIKTVFHNGSEIIEMQNVNCYFEGEDGKSFQYNLNASLGQVNKNEIIYPNSLANGIDIRISQKGGYRKLDYILNNNSIFENTSNQEFLTFEESIKLQKGWTVILKNEQIILLNEKGIQMAVYLAPTVFDSNQSAAPNYDSQINSNNEIESEPNNFSQKDIIFYEFETKDNSITIKTKIRLNWLKSTDRIFPIIIDPSLSSGSGLTWLISNNYSANSINISTSGAPTNSSITSVVHYTNINSMYYDVCAPNGCWNGFWGSCSTSANYTMNLRSGDNITSNYLCNGTSTNSFNCYNPNNNWYSTYNSHWNWRYIFLYSYSLTVNYLTLLTPTINTTPLTGCIGYDPAAISLTNSPGGSGTLTYQWFLNGAAISGATSSSYNPPATTNAGTYSYTLRVTDGCGKTALSTAKTITINGYGQTTSVSSTDLIWKGSINTDWTNVNNWSTYNSSGFVNAATVPSTSTNVIIPLNGTCVLNQPTLGANTGNSKNLTIETGASLTLTSGTLNVTGNWMKSGTLNAGTSNINFTGGSAQTIGGTGTTTFYNCKINNSSTGLTLNSPVSITNSLNMTTGNVVTTNTNILTLGVSAPATLSWTAGTVVGPFKRWFTNSTNSGNSSGLFPVGINSGSVINRWALFEYTSAPTTAGYLSVEFKGTNPSLTSAAQNGLPLTEVDELNDIATDGYWEVIPTGLAGGTYSPSLRANSFSNSDVYTTGRIIKSPDPHTTWTLSGSNVASTGTASDFVLKRTGMSGFSFFAVGFQGFVPLPIELINFQANCISENKIQIDWQTSSENNSDYYLLEKSLDGYLFNELTTISASGNSTTLQSYRFIDRTATDRSNYYRLTQFDQDGKSETFNIAEANCIVSEEEILVYPNPTKGDIYLQINHSKFIENGTATLFTLNGKLLSTTSFSVDNKQNNFRIANENYTPGVYFLKVESEYGMIKTIKIILE
jgi:hypothetical protein